MSEKTDDQRELCVRRCRDKFIAYTARKPVGGVEALRICRENCDQPGQER